MNALAAASAIAAAGCVIAAAVQDVRRFEIADGLSIAIVLLFLPFAASQVHGWEWAYHAAAGAAIFAVGVGLFAMNWMGGGDVKLLGACALWAGLDGLPTLMLGTMLAGGVLASVALVGRRLAGNDSGHAYPGLRAGGPIPYAVAILGGVATWAATIFS
ncbi:A24 family peptidase [Glacieibacterium sp.]|uniref:A24 family peptidase n=1 Tax=Glacieibacterium sp. TaxID=2860237 RepID=UPI003B00ED78